MANLECGDTDNPPSCEDLSSAGLPGWTDTRHYRRFRGDHSWSRSWVWGRTVYKGHGVQPGSLTSPILTSCIAAL